MKAVRIAVNPLRRKAAATELGPICFPGQLDKIKHYVDEASRSGAEIIAGGDDRGMGGLFFAPTIIGNVTNDAPVCQDEIFGPVLAMLPFSDEQEAIDIANASVSLPAFGLLTFGVRSAWRSRCVSARCG